MNRAASCYPRIGIEPANEEMEKWPRTIVGVACWAVLGAAGWPGEGPPARTGAPGVGARSTVAQREPIQLAETRERERFDRSRARERSSGSERELRIRRAREEIQRNPEQKKFILFRFGLTEEDLR